MAIARGRAYQFRNILQAPPAQYDAQYMGRLVSQLQAALQQLERPETVKGGTLFLEALPTDPVGLQPGDVWNDSGILRIVGPDGGSAEVSLAAAIGAWEVLAHSAVAVSATGSIGGHTLATVTVPGNTMGPNGIIRAWSNWTSTSSANSKTYRTRFGGAATSARVIAVTTAIYARELAIISNRNDPAIQTFSSPSANLGGWQQITVSATATEDTTGDVDVWFEGVLTNAGETVTLESYHVEVLYGA